MVAKLSPVEINDPKIEKGVPIPGSSGRGGRGKWTSLLRAMEVNDSVLMDDITTTARAHGRFQMVAIKCSKKFLASVVEGGVRVWRIA